MPKKMFFLSVLVLVMTAIGRNTSVVHATHATIRALRPTFIENVQLADPAAKFVSIGGGRTAFFTSADVRLVDARRRHALWLTFPGGSPSRVAGEHATGGRVTHLRSGGRAEAQLAVRDVVYREVWPGVDVRFTGAADGLEYAFEIAPHAASDAIRLRYLGVEALTLDASGNLQLRTPDETVIDRAPIAFQLDKGARVAVSVRYVLTGGDIAFEVGAYDPSRPLVIDPTIVYSTFLGGSGNDAANGIAVDASGAAYVAGTTSSLDLPTTPGAYQASFRGGGERPTDAFVAKLSPDGDRFEYVTYLGGSGNDAATSIAVDAGGHAYVAGFTESADFPTAGNPLRPSIGSTHDAFVAKLTADGSALAYATFLGGNATTDVARIAVDGSGHAYVAGTTTATNIPVTSTAVVREARGGRDGYLVKLSPDGSAVSYGTYVGGTGDDDVLGVAVGSGGRAFLTGRTWKSHNVPMTAGVVQPRPNSAIFRSDDAAGAFVPVNGGVQPFDVRALAIDPQAAAIVYAATADLGILESSDRGQTWAAVNHGLGGTVSANDVAVNPNTPTTVFATATTDNTGGSPHLFRSTDAGASWTDVAEYVSRLAIARSNPSTIYGVRDSDVIRSTDGGTTWRSVLDAAASAVVVDPTNAANVYVGTRTAEVFRSTDGGNSWTSARVTPPPFTPTISAVAVDPSDPSVVWAAMTNSGLTRSTNGGVSWSYVANYSGSEPEAMAFDGATLYVTALSRVYSTSDRGATFTSHAVSGAFQGQQALAADNGLVFVGGLAAADAFVWSIDTTAATNALVYGTYVGGSSFDAGRAIALDPSDHATVVIATSSTDLPTTNGSVSDNQIHALLRLNGDGSAYEQASFFGPRGSYVIIYGLAVDRDGFAYATGIYDDDDPRILIDRIDPAGMVTNELFINTSGFQSWEAGQAIAVGADGTVYVAGVESSGDFATTPGAAQRTFGGGSSDAFVLKVSFGDAAALSTDLARGRPAVASSVEGPQYSAANAVDGDPDTRWSSEFSDPQWIDVDLGQRIDIDRIVLRWETAYASDFAVQVSDDAVQWVEVRRVGGSGGTQSLFNLHATGRYVRIYGTHRGTPWGYSLWAFEVYGTPASAPPSSNLALNRPVFVSSVEAQSYSGAFAVDGDASTRWSSRFADPQSITIDLGRIAEIARVVLRWETAFGADYTIEASETGSTYQTIKTVTNGDGGVDDWSGLSGRGRYIRLTGTRRGTEWGYSLYEFEVYGPGGGQTEPPASASEIVIYASDVPATALHDWTRVDDSASPQGTRLSTVDAGFAATSEALSEPSRYIDATFDAPANTPFTIWLRLKAADDLKFNDSVWVQFSDAIADGGAIYPIGSSSGLSVNLATDGSASSLHGWGWQNTAYWLDQATTVTFAASGTHTIRIQVREDGVQLDQIVLSASRYLSSPPGGPTNDSTIVPK